MTDRLVIIIGFAALAAVGLAAELTARLQRSVQTAAASMRF